MYLSTALTAIPNALSHIHTPLSNTAPTIYVMIWIGTYSEDM